MKPHSSRSTSTQRDPPLPVIRETITFSFDDEAQQARFHERLAVGFADMSWEVGFAEQVWGLSLLAQAELDNGDTDGVQKTLVRIAEVAAAAAAAKTST